MVKLGSSAIIRAHIFIHMCVKILKEFPAFLFRKKDFQINLYGCVSKRTENFKKITCLKFYSNCLVDTRIHVKCWPSSETQSIYTIFLDFNMFLYEKFLINKFLLRLRVTFFVEPGPYELYDFAVTTRSTARPCQVRCP